MFKRRIGITQKVIKHHQYNEMIDCLDTRWTTLLTSLGFLTIPLPNLESMHVPMQFKELKLDGLILSGGNTPVAFADENDNPESLSAVRDSYELSVIDEAIKNNLPVLGVCRGLQILNCYYKGSLVKIKGNARERNHRLIVDQANDLFSFPSNVNSYHDYGVPSNKLGDGLIPLAYDEGGFIEAFSHTRDKVLAIMWHPERELPLLDSDCTLIKQYFES